MAVQRCTVHKHRNLLAHAPERLHEETSNDYRDMDLRHVTRGEVETRRKAFIRKWRLKSRVVADSLEESATSCSTFTAVPAEPMEIDPNPERDRAIARGVQAPDQDQTVLACADTAAMLAWALLTSGQIIMRKVDGWHTLAEKPDDQIIDLAA